MSAISSMLRSPNVSAVVAPSRLWQKRQIAAPLARNRTHRHQFIEQGSHTADAPRFMIDRPDNPNTAPERQAEAILSASDQEVRNYMMERRLSTLVRRLNWLERQPRTRALARRALNRLGFPTA